MTTRLRNRIETAAAKANAATGGLCIRVAIVRDGEQEAELARLKRDEGWTDDDRLVVLVPATGRRAQPVLH